MSQGKSIPSRIIPTLETEAQIVRCLCSLRYPSGPMIKCTRCGCLSHKKCVSVRDPFICEYCHQAAQRVLIETHNAFVTPTGSTIEISALKDALLNEFSVIEVCEIREHCVSSGQIATLLDHLLVYFATLDSNLDHLEQFSLNVIDEVHKDEVQKEISAKRDLYRRICSAVMEMKDEWDDYKKSLSVLP